jgi:hypothetical protein
MTDPTRLKSAQELREIAGSIAAVSLPDEIADTLPVPRRVSGKRAVQILYYRESGPPERRRLTPPEQCLLLDAHSGQLLRFWACRPEELGILPTTPAVPGAGIRDGMTVDEYVEKEERLLAISRPLWQAFFEGAADEDAATRARALEYQQLFLETNDAEVAKFLVASAPDFFRWLAGGSR